MSTIRKIARPKTCVLAEPIVSPEPIVSSSDPLSTVVADVIAPVRRKRPTKIVLEKPIEQKEPDPPIEPHITEPPKEPIKVTKAPKAPKAPKEPKAPKKSSASKKAKPIEQTDAIPLLHKEVTLPTHQEMNMEEYNADGFLIQHVTLSVFTHEGNTYFRDKRKNKLYHYGGPRRVGAYLGRYHPGREEIFTDLPDSDAEEL